MRINNNISALNAYNNLQKTDGALSKSLERLSSGLRINRAADDAAGLAISEKMRGQISGLNQAVRNAQDGISMIQTAEGALNETHSILQRMRELSVQSANDTNTADDRANLQKEVDQLSQELSRIAGTTEFNTKKLLDGSFEGKFQIGANENQNISLGIEDMRGQALGVTGSAKFTDTSTISAGTNTKQDLKEGTYTIEMSSTTAGDLKDENGNIVAKTTDGGKNWTMEAAFGDDTFSAFKQQVNSGTITVSGTKMTGTAEFTSALEAGSYSVDYASGASTLKDANGDIIATSTDDKTFKNGAGDVLLTLDTATSVDMDIEVGGTDISSQSAANNAIKTLDTAISKVSTQRSELGAYQNRLEHTINNLGTSAENLTAAESRVRDLDMASEMSKFTRNQILIQAGTSMMAQANQKPQSVLSLLG